MLLDLADVGRVKVVQKMRFLVEGARLCLLSAQMRPEDVRAFSPATARADLTIEDRRISVEDEARLRRVVMDVWSAQIRTCWAYRYEELLAESPGRRSPFCGMTTIAPLPMICLVP